MEKAELSQLHLARYIKINQGKLSMILSSKANPNKSEVKKLEQAFRLPIHVLLEEMTDGRKTRVA